MLTVDAKRALLADHIASEEARLLVPEGRRGQPPTFWAAGGHSVAEWDAQVDAAQAEPRYLIGVYARALADLDWPQTPGLCPLCGAAASTDCPQCRATAARLVDPVAPYVSEQERTS